MADLLSFLKSHPVYSNTSKQPQPLSNLRYKYLGLYFTAAWCGACIQFSNVLKRVYSSANKQKQVFEIVSFTLDQTLEDFERVSKGYPWWTFSNLDIVGQLAYALKVQHIPRMVVLNSQGRTISNDGVRDIKKHQEGVIEYWDTL